jgi:hypothetical protein
MALKTSRRQAEGGCHPSERDVLAKVPADVVSDGPYRERSLANTIDESVYFTNHI